MRTARALTALMLVLGAPRLAGQQKPAPRPNQDTPQNAQTQRPPLHGKHWMAITGKPLGAPPAR